MDEDGALWGRYFQQPQLKSSLGLQLMPGVGERVTMPFLSDGHGRSYTYPECCIPDSLPSKKCIFPPRSFPDLPSIPIDYGREIWYPNHGDNGKMLHVFPVNHHHLSYRYRSILPEAAVENHAHTLEMLQLVDASKEQNLADNGDPGVPSIALSPLKKRRKGQGQGRPIKEPKLKKTKKAIVSYEEPSESSKKGRSAKKSLDMVINGIELDLSGIPAPLCTCTGQPQQCYRWGAGGWQSACCTTSISSYPLPLSTKRRGARISGRKMSQGAFKKVLEKLAGEGQDFSSPINLKPFWAKHGTNKFVTIR